MILILMSSTSGPHCDLDLMQSWALALLNLTYRVDRVSGLSREPIGDICTVDGGLQRWDATSQRKKHNMYVLHKLIS